MKKFAVTWPDGQIVQQVVAQLPWSQNVTLLDRKAVVLLDERYAKRSLAAAEANIDFVSARALFRVLTEEFGLNDTAGYWRLVLHNLDAIQN